MKKNALNTTVSYDPVTLVGSTSIKFTRITRLDGTAIYGKVVKDGTDVGLVSYDSRTGSLTTTLRPMDALTGEEVSAVYASVPGNISELLAD